MSAAAPLLRRAAVEGLGTAALVTVWATPPTSSFALIVLTVSMVNIGTTGVSPGSMVIGTLWPALAVSGTVIV